MASPLPTPVAAALGLVPAALDGVKRLPARAVALPLQAVTHSLTTLGQVRQGYDDLALRGERLVARLRGQAGDAAGDLAERADRLEDRVEDLVERTPLASAYDRAEDALEDAGDGLRAVAGTATRATKKATEKAADALESVPEAEQPKGVPTPKATEPDSTRVDTAVTPEVEAVVEDTAAAVAVEVPAHDELPLPDYDHMTLGSLRGRLRSLSVEQLVAVRAYEKAHADRLPVVTMLDNRIAKLAADSSAAPAGTPSTAPAPEQQATAGGSAGKVSAATASPPAGTPVGAKPTLSQN